MGYNIFIKNNYLNHLEKNQFKKNIKKKKVLP